MSDPSDQCALDANGNLKPAANINFYFNKDDNVPMSGPQELLEAEKCDEDGQPTVPTNSGPHHCRKTGGTMNGINSDPDDGDFSAENEESPINTASKSKRACHYIIEDDSEDRGKGDEVSKASKLAGPVKQKCRVGKRNPIHYFYEPVPVNSDGKARNTSDKHFKCYHGNWKILKANQYQWDLLSEPCVRVIEVGFEMMVKGLVTVQISGLQYNGILKLGARKLDPATIYYLAWSEGTITPLIKSYFLTG
ncbi:hypothetical protein IW261DRAFT_1426420 [Armillaria novae-zelandiae]|uniref:Uncharacterized protein n=1 Tax=Armillaria novae-zelandiae TaxID=153914 RepID=A0AA39NL62_9AGAR|nr:hypothetical protein IW261DRAFT_1426420 [Armillaria novae-zelandiae]